MKTVTLRDDVYDRLLRLKKNNESFSDVIDGLLDRKPGGIEELFGVLGESPLLDEIEQMAKDSRGKTKVRK